MSTQVDVIAGERYSLPTIMRKAGLNDGETQIGVVGMWWSPDESNPDSAITHVIVKGVQNLLRRLGVKLKATGFYGEYTHQALTQVLGRQYTVVGWVQIYEALISKIARREMAQVQLFGSDFTAGRYEAMGVIDSSNFTMSSSSWSAKTSSARNLVTTMQLQVNRYASRAGFGLLDVDGVVGSQTASAVVSACAWAVNSGYGSDETIAAFASPSATGIDLIGSVATNADAIGSSLKSLGDQLGAGAAGASDFASNPSGVSPSGSSGRGGGSTPVLVAQGSSFPIVPAALGLGALWLLMSKPKKGRKKKGWF